MTAIPSIATGVQLPVVGGVDNLRPTNKSGTPFAQVITELVQDTNDQQLLADQSVRDLITGKADSVHGVVLSVAKADLAFRMVLEIRNRLVDSYQEIMRMQV